MIQSAQASLRRMLLANQVELTNFPVESRNLDSRIKYSDNSSFISLRVHWEKLPGYAGTAGGSENIFCDLFGNEDAQDTFWLDSSTRDQVCQ